jgi:hypothetical protein
MAMTASVDSRLTISHLGLVEGGHKAEPQQDFFAPGEGALAG